MAEPVDPFDNEADNLVRRKDHAPAVGDVGVADVVEALLDRLQDGLLLGMAGDLGVIGAAGSVVGLHGLPRRPQALGRSLRRRSSPAAGRHPVHLLRAGESRRLGSAPVLLQSGRTSRRQSRAVVLRWRVGCECFGNGLYLGHGRLLALMTGRQMPNPKPGRLFQGKWGRECGAPEGRSTFRLSIRR